MASRFRYLAIIAVGLAITCAAPRSLSAACGDYVLAGHDVMHRSVTVQQRNLLNQLHSAPVAPINSRCESGECRSANPEMPLERSVLVRFVGERAAILEVPVPAVAPRESSIPTDFAHSAPQSVSDRIFHPPR